MPNWSQLSGVVERVIWIGLTWATAKGWITNADAVNLAAMILAILAAIYAFVVNRNTNLVKQAAAVPDTTVITQPAIADNTVQSNIVSSATSEVKPK